MRQRILSQLFPLLHIPHVIPFPFTQAENTLETQRGRELFPEFIPPHKIYCVLFSLLQKTSFPSTTPNPSWPFSEIHYLRKEWLLLMKGVSLNFIPRIK